MFSIIVFSGCMKKDMLKVVKVSSSEMLLLLVGKNCLVMIMVKVL